MSRLRIYETEEDPEEFARRVCEWHAANQGEPLTHIEVMIHHVKMRDPISRSRCMQLVKRMTGPGGEFEQLRKDGKFAVDRKSTADVLGVPYRPIRRANLVVQNNMLIVTRGRKTLAAREHLPETVKEPMSRIMDTVEQYAGRPMSVARASEIMENLRETGAAGNYEIRGLMQTITQLQQRLQVAEELLFASLGRGGLPPGEQAEAAD